MNSSKTEGDSATERGKLDDDSGSLLHTISAFYQGFHGYLSASLCVFGIVSNLMNIVVLTRKSMVSPTNCILTALAISDLLTMVVYLPYVVYFHCVTIPDQSYPHPRGWIVYLLFNSYFTITAHTVSMWLTVALAVFRYVAVCHHTRAPTMCNLARARLAIACIVVSTPVFCVPNYVLYRSVPVESGSQGWWFEENPFVGDVHRNFNNWLFGVVLKVIPCILLVVLSALLLNAMKTADIRRRSLLRSKAARSGGGDGAAEGGDSREHNRTTRMLVTVVMFFVATEFPQGLLALLSGIDQRIFDEVYVPLGDIWDVVAIINSAVNFLLYCTMSARFRATFRDVFCAKRSCRARCSGCYRRLSSGSSQSRVHSCSSEAVQMPLLGFCRSRRQSGSLSSWTQYEDQSTKTRKRQAVIV